MSTLSLPWPPGPLRDLRRATPAVPRRSRGRHRTDRHQPHSSAPPWRTQEPSVLVHLAPITQAPRADIETDRTAAQLLRWLHRVGPLTPQISAETIGGARRCPRVLAARLLEPQPRRFASESKAAHRGDHSESQAVANASCRAAYITEDGPRPRSPGRRSAPSVQVSSAGHPPTGRPPTPRHCAWQRPRPGPRRDART